jgi:hypothetical protein
MFDTTYRKQVAFQAIQIAMEDPLVVKEVIARLSEAGEIEPDDLTHLERIADRWIRIAQENQAKGQRR